MWDSKLSSSFISEYLTYRPRNNKRSWSPSTSLSSIPFFFFSTVFTPEQIFTWTWWVELETDCCLYLNCQGDSIAGTQGRPPSDSDMAIRSHYPTSGSFIWVYTSLSPRHTHFSHGLPWKSFTPEVQIKTERGARESQECGKSQPWRNSSGSIFICFLPWLCLHYSSEAFFFFS